MKITLTTGGAPHYEAGLVAGLLEQNLSVEVIGGPELQQAAVMHDPRVRYLNLHGPQLPDASPMLKLLRAMRVYWRLLRYAAGTDSPLLHLQWPYKLVLLDHTALNLCFKLLGKKLVFTAHNVDTDARDGTSNWLKRAALRFHYRAVDHIIVHTTRMKEELSAAFGIPAGKVSVIPHGLMTAVPETGLSKSHARRQLALADGARVLLFFGLISPYKGLENLIHAIGDLKQKGQNFILLIAGRVKECPEYWAMLERLIQDAKLQNCVRTELRHIPDEEVEAYFTAADVLLLPYRGIFQSGVLFLGYRFGLPVIATDVGSFAQDILPGKTGFVCRPNDPHDLARAIETYFASPLFAQLEQARLFIKAHAAERYSWSKIGQMTRKVYDGLLQG